MLAPKAFAARPRDEWIKLFGDADLAVKPVLRPAEILDDEQVRHAGMTVEVDDPVLGPVRQTSPVIVFADSPAATPRPAPLPDQHRAEAPTVRSAWRDRSGADRPAGHLAGALDGIRILDLSSFFATGYGAKLLSDLGADVIKIEQPAGDQLRPFPDPFEACNRGKRSLAIDLRTPAGLAAVTEARRHRRRRDAQPAAGEGREARCRSSSSSPPSTPTSSTPTSRGSARAVRGGTRRASSRCCRASPACSTRPPARATRRSARRSATPTTTTACSARRRC